MYECLLLSHAKTADRIKLKFSTEIDYSITHRLFSWHKQGIVTTAECS